MPGPAIFQTPANLHQTFGLEIHAIRFHEPLQDMKRPSQSTQLRRDMHRLVRSMDFVSRHPALERDTAEAERFAEVYQQLGLAWEFLALQCRHRAGWRKLRDGKS